MVVITLLAVLYPIVNSLKEHYYAESRVPSDEIDNKKNIFETYFLAAYYLWFFVLLPNLTSRISPVEGGDNENVLRRMRLTLLGYALLLPLLLLLLNPKRLYARWQEEKIEFLHKHSIQLLEGLLPGKVIAHFRQSKEAFVEKFSCVTILFVDIMDFTVVCRLLTPSQIVLLLDAIFNQFDEAAEFRGVYRVETIGDCYMASTGCPDAEDPSIAAERMVLFAQDLIQIVRDFQPPCNIGFPLQIRIGVHSGPVVAGTLSGKMLRYCLFGDTVNTASRMESTGEVARIHLSEDTVSLVRKDATCSYDFESRLPMHVKGKGVMSTYFLDTPERNMSKLYAHFRESSRSNSEADEPEPHFLLKNISASSLFSFTGSNKTANATSNSNSNVRKPRVAPMTSDSVSKARRKMVVPSNEYDLELGVVANPPKSAPMDMAFVTASSLLSWDFDVQNIVSKDMLIDISFTLFETSWLCGPLGVSEITLRNFIENVAGLYHRKSFHNLQHAVSVLHITALLTNYCNQKSMM
jgi:class 3 adenylate cyclase